MSDEKIICDPQNEIENGVPRTGNAIHPVHESPVSYCNDPSRRHPPPAPLTHHPNYRKCLRLICFAAEMNITKMSHKRRYSVMSARYAFATPLRYKSHSVYVALDFITPDVLIGKKRKGESIARETSNSMKKDPYTLLLRRPHRVRITIAKTIDSLNPNRNCGEKSYNFFSQKNGWVLEQNGKRELP